MNEFDLVRQKLIATILNFLVSKDCVLEMKFDPALNARFYDKACGYYIESLLDKYLNPDDPNCLNRELDTIFMGRNVEIKCCKNHKYINLRRWISSSERAFLKADGILVFIDYTKVSGSPRLYVTQFHVINGEKVRLFSTPGKLKKEPDTYHADFTETLFKNKDNLVDKIDFESAFGKRVYRSLCKKYN